ncbi:MAG: ATP-binding protein [Candidatus Omnitrophota bacterium]
MSDTIPTITNDSADDESLEEDYPTVPFPFFEDDGNRPSSPACLEEVGLSASFLSDLIVKHLHRFGVLTGLEIAEKIRLPFPLLEPLLNEIIIQLYAEKKGGQGLGAASDRFGLTDRGRRHIQDLLALDTYIGPAPVPLDQYWSYIQKHHLHSIRVTEALLREAWCDFIVDDSLFRQIGPAIRSGKSCFLYGPPGTGKTTFAKKIAQFYNQHGGPIAVPHALFAGGSIIRVYDPIHHKELTPSAADANRIFKNQGGDRRWALCRRPAVIVGGELELSMLDLRYNPSTRYYEAPLQMKANGGLLIIDDFGRQMVQPRDLLNRWIIPLEERLDYLTLHTGKKFSIPFEQLVVFATNMNPMDLVDEAFLRRIRYKIYIGEPSAVVYKSIFMKECHKKELEIAEADLDEIIRQCYLPANRPLRACDPRDITDQIADYCDFNELSKTIPFDLLKAIVAAYLTEINVGS